MFLLRCLKRNGNGQISILSLAALSQVKYERVKRNMGEERKD